MLAVTCLINLLEVLWYFTLTADPPPVFLKPFTFKLLWSSAKIKMNSHKSLRITTLDKKQNSITSSLMWIIKRNVLFLNSFQKISIFVKAPLVLLFPNMTVVCCWLQPNERISRPDWATCCDNYLHEVAL